MKTTYYMRLQTQENKKLILKKELTKEEILYSLWCIEATFDDALYNACVSATKDDITGYDAKNILKSFGFRINEILVKIEKGYCFCLQNDSAKTITSYSIK